MKNNTRLLTLSFALLASIHPASAVDLYWDGTDTTADADGGDGIWNNVLTNWDTAATGGSDSAFTNWSDNAIFGGAGGTVTLGASNIVAPLITVASGGYTFELNGLTTAFWMGFNGIQVDSGASLDIIDTPGTGSVNLPVAVGTWPTKFQADGDISISAKLSGVAGGGVVKDGLGTLTLSGANDYDGITNLVGGVLQTDLADGVGTGALGNGGEINFTGGTLQYTANSAGTDYSARIANSTSAITLDTNGQNVTFANVLDDTNTAGLTKVGTGTLSLSGANTYTGTTTINAGTLQADVADVAATSGALGNGGNITFTGGELQYTANSAATDYSARIVNSSSAITIDTNGQTVVLDDAILSNTNTGGLIKNGTGTLEVQSMAVAGSYTGDTVVNGGTLRLTNTVDLGQINSTAMNFKINNGSTLEVASSVGGPNRTVNNNQTYTFDSNGGGTLNFASGNHLFQGSGHVLVSTGGSQNTFSNSDFGFINGQGTAVIEFQIADGTDAVDFVSSATLSNARIIKNGAGVLSVSSLIGNVGGASALVEAGTLLVNGNLTADGSFTVESGAAIGVSGDRTISGTLVLEAGANFVFSETDTLTVVGAATLANSFGVANLVTASGGVIDWSSVALGTYTLIDGAGAVDFSNILNFGIGNAAALGATGNIGYFQNGSLQFVVAVPEPSAYALLAGLLGLSYVMVRRRK